MKGSGGQNNRNKSEGDRSQNNLVNRSQQTHVPNHGNRALDHRRDSQNQLGKPNQQKQQHTHYSKTKLQTDKEKWTIFDRWVKFRDKYLADSVNGGFQKLGFFGKFAYQRAVNSETVNNLKQQVQQESSNIKGRFINAQRSITDTFNSNKNNDDNSTKSFIYEKLGQGKDYAQQKLGEGSEVLKEKIKEGSPIVKEKVSQGAEALKETLKKGYKEGSPVLKEKVSQGAEAFKETLKKGYAEGSPIIKEKVSQGASIVQDALKKGYEEGSPILKEKVSQGASKIQDALKKGYEQRGPMIKEKAEQLSNASLNSVKGLGNAAGNAANSAYDSVTSAPDMITKRATKYARRTGIYVFLGVTTVAFVYAIGSRLPHAYFDYQLKKEQLKSDQTNQRVAQERA